MGFYIHNMKKGSDGRMEETRMPLILMNRLSKTYGATRALNEVSLRIPEG